MKKLFPILSILFVLSACSSGTGDANEVAFVADGVEVTKSDLFHDLNAAKNHYAEIDSHSALIKSSRPFYLWSILHDKFDQELYNELVKTSPTLAISYDAVSYKNKNEYSLYLDSLVEINIDLHHHSNYWKTESKESLEYLKENNSLLYNHIMGMKNDLERTFIDRLKPANL